ncbi:ABC transporter ATP-binding protein [Streptomyces sp. NEAU-sy36]|uniref:ABC transporter ATP-binding protein n=1 Tax=unclassified Streptomyces TaxID=2593676 RepID=UPI0015D588C1|nr:MULTISPECIES: ABC transporter ATP-binding protein [unclassified Streptomyces]QLJ00681.1 ABC transporter ATP-binding protein [Streptomyces sp. NEAU-sy36]
MTEKDEDTAVSFTGAVRAYGSVRAVDGVDLRIGRGETVALLGRNGAGKSTTIGLLLGLYPPDAGRVELFGTEPERAVRAGRVGAMLQDARPVPRVTVGELVGFVASRYPAPMPVPRALELAGIAALAGRRVDRLSGGQVQRVRFAVALAGDPSLLVLDEPTAALDVEARHVFWEAMRGYARRGHTVVFSTHYLEEADDFADRIVVMDRGRIVADGTGEELRRAAGGGLVTVSLAGRDPDGLALLPGVRSLEVHGDRARLRTDDSDATVVALAELGAIRGLEVAPASLDDAFLALTSPARDDRTAGHGTSAPLDHSPTAKAS